MKIGEFIVAVDSTKDTVRHYESLDLIRPKWENNYRNYTEKDVTDFLAIKEMQELGMNLKGIHAIFEMKRKAGCGTPDLLDTVEAGLKEQLLGLNEKLKEVNRARDLVNNLLGKLADWRKSQGE